MKTNLIQSYLSENHQYNSRKAERDFDVNKELATRTFIKPLPAHGHLVKNNIFDIPSEIAKDSIYNIKSLKHAINGDANDHELGKINDIGMKLGGLAIASYLFTKKATPMTKIMEFIGLGSFFAAMDIWPKLALQLPAKLIHGFDIRQKYEDNYGRKKMFYQDHQFIPWDLYSDEEINKIGDRMRVPKDMKNRREYIQEKMRKIALQNNTMWMLTSGFATPIMSALICNSLENPIQNYQTARLNKKANALMTNFPQEIEKYDFSKNTEKLNKILSENSGKNLTPELREQIIKTMKYGLNPVIAESLESDIIDILPSMNKYNIDSETLNSIHNALKKNFEQLNLSPKELSEIIPDQTAIEKALREKDLIKEGLTDFSQHAQVIQSLLSENIEKYIRNNSNTTIGKKLNLLRKKLVHSSIHGQDATMFNSFKVKHSAILNEKIIDTLQSSLKIVNDLRAKMIVLNEYGYIKYAQAPETILANTWNDISKNLIRILDITDNEIKNTRYDRKLIAELLRNKFDQIVANDTKYSQVINSLQQELSKLTNIRTFEDNGDKEIGDLVFKDRIDSTFNEAANAFKKLGLNSTSDSLVGFDSEGTTSLKYIYLKFAQDRVMGVKSSFYRLLNTLDVYRRISKLENANILSTTELPREAKEELVELCKDLLISGHSSDYSVKFYLRRFPELNPQDEIIDRSSIEINGGRIKNKYLGSHNEADLVELSNDKKFYQEVMRLMYGEELHPDTMKEIKNTGFIEDFLNYRKQILKYIGRDEYFARPHHLLGPKLESSSLLRMLLLGSATDDMIAKQGRQTFNSTKWLKMFGKFGATLLGITVLSQFFMGKMPKQWKEAK